MTTPQPLDQAEEKGLQQLLAYVPRLLASKSHVLLLIGVLIWLIPVGLAVPGLAPDRLQLLLGNYTNIASAIGASIAAGGTIATARTQAAHGRSLAELHRKVDAAPATLPAGGPGAQGAVTSLAESPLPTQTSGPSSPRWNDV